MSVDGPNRKRNRQSERLEHIHERVKYWLGPYHDLDAVDVVLAAAAVEKLDGEPLWILVLDAGSTGKTETVSIIESCAGVECVSTFTSDAGLLSGTPRDEASSDATGGMMRSLEPHGIMLIKDVTSILSLGYLMRDRILAAFRDIYDGNWWRVSGGEGGQKLEWHGRIALIGAVTVAWDRAYAAISQMGDRFVLIRTASTENRIAKGLKAIQNIGQEPVMRAELTTKCRELIAIVPRYNNDDDAELSERELKILERLKLTDTEHLRLVRAANLVTHARTSVEFDRYRRDVIRVDDLEGPQRFAKQLGQVVRGARAIGRNRSGAMDLAIRCARDSMPPIRLAIMEDLNQHGKSNIADVTKRLGKARSTVRRGMESLEALGILVVDEAASGVSSYSIAEGVEVNALAMGDPQSI